MNTSTVIPERNRLNLAMLSLEGLSVGDAFGQSFFFVPSAVADSRQAERHIPPPPWFYTDDTVMAAAVVKCLGQYGKIDQDWLAHEFAREYRREPDRGYGGTARGILHRIAEGMPWRTAAAEVFDGEGSCGNGGAMRAAPLGAWIHDDLKELVEQAKRSAAVTHAHPDGQAGAIAVALAAAWMVTQFDSRRPRSHRMIEFVLAHLPRTETWWRLKKALTLPLEMSPRTVALILGNGSQVISSDTVPFCLWCVCRHPDDYKEALWSAVSVHGDMDTNCAIAGSLVALGAGYNGIPADWLAAREPLLARLS